MSSSMRWRSGLMGFSLMSLEVGVLDPSILKTERPPVTRARSNGYCARRNTPGPAASPPPARAGSFMTQSGSQPGDLWQSPLGSRTLCHTL
jgi:hypothetical protein